MSADIEIVRHGRYRAVDRNGAVVLQECVDNPPPVDSDDATWTGLHATNAMAAAIGFALAFQRLARLCVERGTFDTPQSTADALMLERIRREAKP